MPVLFDHEVGDNTCHFTAILQNCVGYGAHQSDASGTVYQTDMLFGKQAAELFGCFKIYGGYLSAGCAVYAYGMYLIHCLLQVYWMNGYKSTKKSYTYQNECAIYVSVCFLEFKAIGYRRNYAIKVDFICLRYIHRFIIFFTPTPCIDRKYILPVIEVDN